MIGQWLEDTADRTRRILDKGQVARTVMLYTTLYMTWRYFTWSLDFAQHSPRPGVDIAAILAATGVVVGGLQGYVFKAYLDGRPA